MQAKPLLYIHEHAWPATPTIVCDENGFLQRDLRQTQVAFGHFGFVGFPRKLLLLLLGAFEVGGDVRFPVA